MAICAHFAFLYNKINFFPFFLFLRVLSIILFFKLISATYNDHMNTLMLHVYHSMKVKGLMQLQQNNAIPAYQKQQNTKYICYFLVVLKTNYIALQSLGKWMPAGQMVVMDIDSRKGSGKGQTVAQMTNWEYIQNRTLIHDT